MMEFEKPSMVEIPRKELSRMYGLVQRLENHMGDPGLNDLDKILRRLLRLDEKYYQAED